MTLYIVGLVITIIGWAATTINMTLEAFGRWSTPEKVHRARLAWLSFFLIPLYPAVFIVVMIAGPIMVFRSLGRIEKEDE